MDISMDVLSSLCNEFKKYNHIDSEDFEKYHVKRGLRNEDGTGVMAGLTQICNVRGYVVDDGELQPVAGQLNYRGISVEDIVKGCCTEDRFGFEEVIWLLLFGFLPDKQKLAWFKDVLAECRELPEYFAEDMIIKAPSQNIMNKLARSVLALYSYDNDPEGSSIENIMRQCIELIAKLPTIMVYAYQVKRRHYDGKSMFFHPINHNHSTAEFVLSSIRADRAFTDQEAKLLDICMLLHADHGGGNNSTFTTRVISSSGTDTYSAISAAIGSLKGPKHGGANIKVMEQLEYMKANISNWRDDGEIRDYLAKQLRRQAGDGSGLVYGMGHAVYTVSDPRAVILKAKAREVTEMNGLEGEFLLLDAVERLTPQVLAELKGTEVSMCANVDLYSGLVYQSLGISSDLFTPLFAISRIPGWCAHRMEEITTSNRIIRPAYKAVSHKKEYTLLADR